MAGPFIARWCGLISGGGGGGGNNDWLRWSKIISLVRPFITTTARLNSRPFVFSLESPWLLLLSFSLPLALFGSLFSANSVQSI